MSKSGIALVSPDMHKTELEGNPDFRRGTAYDLEGLGAEAGCRYRKKAGIPAFF